FEPVSLIAYLPNVLLVDPNLGVNSVADLIALLKKDPSKRTFASSGAGTSTHLAGELFSGMIGVPLTHVPYKGTPPAMVDVSSGAVTFMFDQMTAALPLLQTGKLKLLAVTTKDRISLAPDVPTMQEAGVPGFQMASWQAVYAPKGT
ncbi:Bug family tripartite tricarboxylate transporter substrate binding protein, partial [Achromobacter xylosoxidans]